MIVTAGPIASGKTGVFRERSEEEPLDTFHVDDRNAELKHGSYERLPPDVVRRAISPRWRPRGSRQPPICLRHQSPSTRCLVGASCP